MAKAGTLLIVDDNRNILSAVRMLAEGCFARVLTLPSPTALISTLRTERPEVVLLDMNFKAGINTGNEGIFWLGEVLKAAPQTKVVLFTAYGDIELAVKAMKHGAFDFVTKPWANEKLVATLTAAYRAAIGDQRGKRTVKAEAAPRETMLWGESAAMQRVREVVDRVAITDANILLTGENGTGKEMLAREIHNRSSRCNRELVAVDMGAIPDTLFESELFGHTKGAFTDAHADRIGKFEAAGGSTLFLDEIGNLPLHLQAKMLTVLQNRAVVKLGTSYATPIDIRLVAATNCDLFRMAEEGTFRQDLLFRLNTIHIELPPLRNRREDIAPLSEQFLARYAAKYNRSGLVFAPETRQRLEAHTWPGNIRELQHTIEKAVIMADGERIEPHHLQLREAAAPPTPMQTMEEIERQAIIDTIAACNGNLSLAARRLNLTRQTLYNKIKRYNIS